MAKKLSSAISKIKILVVDDEPDILLRISALLERRGHCVKTFDMLAQALEHIASGDVHYDLIITEYRMPGGMTGLDLAKQVKGHKRRKGGGRRETKVFLVSAFDIMSLPELNEPELNEAAKSEIVDEIIQKPIRNDKLIDIIESNFLYNNH